MIVSHKHKIIFLKTKKTAGTSFEIALRSFLDDDDIATPISSPDEELCRSLGFRGPQNFLIEGVEKKNTRLFNHATAMMAKSILGSEIWGSYFKFSIVRNPFDCLVSNYYWGIRNKRNKPSFKDWVFKNPGVLVENNKIINLDSSEEGVDYLIQYENLQFSVSEIERKIPSLAGLYEIFSKISAKGGVRPKTNKASTRELFARNPDVAQLVYMLCSSDIERYHYGPF